MLAGRGYYAIHDPKTLFTRGLVMGNYEVSASTILGDLWTDVMVDNAVDTDNLLRDITEGGWISANVKHKYQPLFRILGMNVISFGRFLQEIRKNRSASYYSDVEMWYKEAKDSLNRDVYDMMTVWDDNSHIVEWFYDMQNVNISMTNIAIVDITSELYRFLVGRGAIGRSVQDLYRIVNAFAIFYFRSGADPVSAAHSFVRMLATPTDYGYLILKGGTNINLWSIGIREEWLGSMSPNDLYVMEGYSFLYTAKKNTMPRMFIFNDNKSQVATVDPEFALNDYEIIERLGGYPAVTTRREALSVYRQMINGHYHFITALPGSFVGYETNVAMETIDYNTFVLVYSNITKKTPFVIDDIRLSIGTTEGGFLTLRLQDADGNDINMNESLARDIIMAVHERFKYEELDEYHNIIAQVPESELDNRIKEMEQRKLVGDDFYVLKGLKYTYVIAMMQEMFKTFKTMGLKNRSLSTANRDKAIELYTDLVSMGLYFRRWKGPGHPFPYSKESTMDITVDPELNAQPYIIKYREILSHPVDPTTKLIVATPRYGDLTGQALDTTFVIMLSNVVRSQECIRVASKSFIYTGYRCLNMLGAAYTVNGETFDPNLLDANMNLTSPEELITNLNNELEHEIRTTNDPHRIRIIEDQLAMLIPNYTRRLL